MAIRARRTVLVGLLACGTLTGLSGCNVAREMTTERMDFGRSEPARVRAQPTSPGQVSQANQPQQRTMLVAADTLGGRIFPDAGMPATSTGNTAVANVPTRGE